MKARSVAYGLSLCLGIAAVAFAGDMIDNPEYKHWSQFKAGTTVTLVSESKSQMNGKDNPPTKTETTTTLVSIDKDKAVVETGGTKRDVPAKVEKKDPPKEEKKPEKKEGEEEVEVCGKKYKCKWTETVTEASGSKTTSKVWTCDEIPGGMAKMTMHMDMPAAKMTSDTTMSVSKCEVKK